MDYPLFFPGYIPTSRYIKELHTPIYLKEMELKKMAKTGNYDACRVLAKELVELRKQKARTDAISFTVTSMSTQTTVFQLKRKGAMFATAMTMPNFQKEKKFQGRSAESAIYRLPSTTYKSNIFLCSRGPFGPPEVPEPRCGCYCCSPERYAPVKVEMTDNMISDTLDDIYDYSEDEEESEDIVNQVLDEFGIEISEKMAKAPSEAEDLPSPSKTEASTISNGHLKALGVDSQPENKSFLLCGDLCVDLQSSSVNRDLFQSTGRTDVSFVF